MWNGWEKLKELTTEAIKDTQEDVTTIGEPDNTQNIDLQGNESEITVR